MHCIVCHQTHLFTCSRPRDSWSRLFIPQRPASHFKNALLHGTIIDQFIACGKSRDMVHELASIIWLAVVDNLEENEQTYNLLKCLASEGDVILPFPYSRSYKVQWRVFERFFTDFRDCLNHVEYCDLLACAKQKFQAVPSTRLGY